MTQISGIKRLAFSLACLALLATGGCSDSPYMVWASWNPWIRREWAEDEQYSATYYRRLEELRRLRKEVNLLAVDQRRRLVQQLDDLIQNDPNAILRAEAVKTLGVFPIDEALPGLRAALKDKSPDVRIAACRVWGRIGGEEAISRLGALVRQDEDQDVRMAAVEQLGRFQSEQAVQALAVALEDRDPALQYQAVRSLRSATGHDFGDNVSAWREYIAGRMPAVPERPSLVERLRDLF